jgi:hypothetical protein
MTHKRRNPAVQGGVSEIVNLWRVDGPELTPNLSFNQAVRHISRRARVSRPHAAVLVELMGVRR